MVGSKEIIIIIKLLFIYLKKFWLVLSLCDVILSLQSITTFNCYANFNFNMISTWRYNIKIKLYSFYNLLK